MYNLGDQVIYCSHGVCVIEDIEERVLDKKKVLYYVLSPLESAKTKYYIPVHNPSALAKIRHLLTREQVLDTLHDPQVFADCWISEENRRKMRYKELTGSHDFFALVQMVYTLEHHRQEQITAGKKFHMTDDNFLRDAKRVLESELSVVFQVPLSEVGRTVKELIQA